MINSIQPQISMHKVNQDISFHTNFGEEILGTNP